MIVRSLPGGIPMKPYIYAALIAAAAITCQPALAHGSTQPKHGGVVSMSGETLFELVNAPAGVQLYVMDDEDPVNAANMTAQLTIDTAGATRNVVLKSAAGNRFDGPALALKPGTKVGVLVIDKTSQAHIGTTFTIK